MLLAAGTHRALAADLQVRAVSEDSTALPDLVLYLTASGGTGATPGRARKTYQVGQKDIQFTPFMSVVPVGARVQFVNNDTVAHHVFSFSDRAPENLELIVRPGSTSDEYVFAREGFSRIGCNIHDGMSAFIFAAPSDLSAVTSAEGIAAITGVPAGSYTLWVWSSEQVGTPLHQQQVDVGGSGASVTITVPAAKRRRVERRSFGDY
jgi:plastocyanin